MIKTFSDAGKEISPPILITAASFLGLGFQSWVYILTAIYTLVQIFRLVPKVIGCGQCFYRNGTCRLDCRAGNAIREREESE